MVTKIIKYQSDKGVLFDTEEEAMFNNILEDYMQEVIDRSIIKSEHVSNFRSCVRQLSLHSDLFEKYAPQLIKLKKKIQESK